MLAEMIALGRIHPSPTNPRKHFDEAKLEGLAKTIAAHGVMQPVLLRPWPEAYTFAGDKPDFELVAGERRWRASKMANQAEIPATIRDLSDDEVLEIQCIENLQREDINALEEAEGYDLMLKRGHKAEALGERIGKSKAYIYGRVKLTALCLKAREAFNAAKLTASTALLIARIPTVDLQEQALAAITTWYGNERILSYREAEKLIHQDYMLILSKAKFPTDDATLCPAAGDCQACPKRTGNNPELYGDVGSADVCTDPGCYKLKVAAFAERQAQAAQAEGKKVITGEAAAKIAPHGTDSSISGYIALDRPNHDLPRSEANAVQTTRQALQGVELETVLIEDPLTGAMIEAIPKTAMPAAMAQAGVDYKDSEAENKAKQRAEERRYRQENVFRERLFAEIHAELDKQSGNDLETSDLRLIARHLWARTDQESRKRVAALMINPGEKMDGHERCRLVTEQIKTMGRRALLLLMLDLALIEQTHVCLGYAINPPTDLMDLAGSLGIDQTAIQAEVARQFSEPAKGKKPAPSAAPKTTPTPPEAPPAEETECAKKPNAEAAIRTDEDCYAEAVKAVTEAGKASHSVIQRALRIGYGQASRLLEMMEAKGLVGQDGNGRRCLALKPEVKEPQVAKVGDRIRILAKDHQIDGESNVSEVCQAYDNGTILTRAHFADIPTSHSHLLRPGQYEILERAKESPDFALGQLVRLRDCGVMIKRAGGKGTITSIYQAGAGKATRYHVRYGDADHEVVSVTADQLAVLDETATVPDQTDQPLAIGDPVRVKDDARDPAGMRRKCAGRSGTVAQILPDKVVVWFGTAPFYAIPLEDLERLPTPPQAARAAGDGEGEKSGEETAKDETSASGAQPGEAIETNEKPTASFRAPVRYRHPEESTIEWTGRGRKPMWVLEWLKQHPDRTLEDLEIPQSSAAPAANETPAAADTTPRCDKTVDMFMEAAA